MCLEAVGPCQGTPRRAGRNTDTSRSTNKKFTLHLSPDLVSSGPRCGHDQYTWHCYLPHTVTRTSLETLSKPAMWPHRLGGWGHHSRSFFPGPARPGHFAKPLPPKDYQTNLSCGDDPQWDRRIYCLRQQHIGQALRAGPLAWPNVSTWPSLLGLPLGC